MASSFFALFDDIATVLDDVAAMTKVAARKTAGVLGDDLALNAQQVSGVAADRELPVVWAVAKGSAINKLILVPAALAISVLAPVLILPLLMLGGAYLCFEGFEKVFHKLLHPREAAAHEAEHVQAVADPALDLVAFERDKIKGAVRTDFILSAEIIVISLGTVATATLGQQLAVLVGISTLMTVGVYGLVAGIVKLDDAGLALSRRANAAAQGLGRALLAVAPKLMKTLSVVGTAAMFMVGGSIVSHGIGPVHHAVVAAGSQATALPGGALLGVLVPTVLDALVGVITGGLVLLGVMAVRKLWQLLRG